MSNTEYPHIFKLRVVYKSGYTHDFEVYQFKVVGTRYEWVSADENNKPVQLGADDIAAIWQIGARENAEA